MDCLPASWCWYSCREGYLRAGAGIVAESVPEDEHRECQNKVAGLARAIDLAESTFVNKS